MRFLQFYTYACVIFIISTSGYASSAKGPNLEAIKSVLAHGHWSDKREASLALGAMTDVEIPVKISLLLEAMETEIKQPSELKKLRGSGRATATESVKIHYRMALVKLGKDAIRYLDTAKNSTPAAQESHKRIVLILGQLGDYRAYPEVIDILKSDPDGYLRKEAAMALRTIGSKADFNILVQSLEDPFFVNGSSDIIGLDCQGVNYPVRDEAATALRSLGLKKIKPTV